MAGVPKLARVGRLRLLGHALAIAIVAVGAILSTSCQDSAGAQPRTVSRRVNVLTWHNDAARTGANLNETILTHENVNASTFGRLFTLTVDGAVDAQPLYIQGLTMSDGRAHNVVYVATEHASVYAFDADTGAQLWHVSLLNTGETPSDPRNCGQVYPEIGITATPVIDTFAGPHGTIYAVAMSKHGAEYFQRFHALDVTTGAEQFGGPVEIQATYPGTGDNSSNGEVVFDPKQYKDRPALLEIGNNIYTTWSSHCDIRPYTGWIIAYDKTTLKQTGVLNLTPNGNEGALWNSGAGPAADASGNIYALVGNGTFETQLNASGFPNKGDFGNAFVKVTPPPMRVADYFDMSNTLAESDADEDLGSGGAIVFDLADNSGTVHHLALGAGKDRNIYIVDRDNMGKFNPRSNNVYQELPQALSQSEFGSPALYNGRVYIGGANDTLRRFSFLNGKLGNMDMQTTQKFTYPGVTPSISANGNRNGIVWVVENVNPAVLHAYRGSDLQELYNSNQAANGRDHWGRGEKWMFPTVVNGKVFVASTNSVGVFGLLR